MISKQRRQELEEYAYRHSRHYLTASERERIEREMRGKQPVAIPWNKAKRMLAAGKKERQRYAPRTLKEKEFYAHIIRAMREELVDQLDRNNRKMSRGHLLLAQALSGWVLRTLHELPVKLTDGEARLFALLITPKGTNRDGEMMFKSYRDIGILLEVSAMTVQRRARNLLKKHKKLADWIADKGITRKPRGTPKKDVTKRKKKI